MLSTIASSFLPGVALKSTVFLVAAALVVLLLRNKSAASRHLVWTLAFGCLLVFPFVSMVIPALRVPIDSSVLPANLIFQTDARAHSVEPAANLTHNENSDESMKPAAGLNWGSICVLLWAAGAAVSLMKMFVGLYAMERLRGKAEPFEVPGFAAMTGLMDIQDNVLLLKTRDKNMPITYGVFRPTVFLPADAANWDPERRRIVLLHELAHVRRHEGATHLLARTALSFYWFNPLAWAAWHEFVKDRERAADDLVLKLGACPSDYAGHLLDVARSMQSPAGFGWAAVPMARRSQLEDRLSAILAPGLNRKAPRPGAVFTASISALFIMAPIAAMQVKSGTPSGAADQSINNLAVEMLVKEGDEARAKGKFDDAKAIYTKALAALGTSPQSATVQIRLGTAQLATQEFDQALTSFGKAEAMDSARAAEAKMWTAIAEQRQNNLQVAETLYQNALATADKNSIFHTTIRNLYAQLLAQEGRKEDADALTKEADAEAREILEAQAATSHKPSAPDVYRIGDGVKAPSLISKSEPDYSPEARIAKYQGTTLLSVEIFPDGTVHDIKVIRPLGLGLDEKAMDAVSRWKFIPATRDDRPVTVFANIEVNFRLL